MPTPPQDPPPQIADNTTLPLRSVSLPRVFAGYVADVVVPMALYYVLHRFGISDAVALAASAAIALVVTIINTIRRKKIDAVGILVIIEIVLSIVLFLLLKDRRLILAKPSFYSGCAAIYLIVMAFRPKPMNYDVIRNVGSDGDPRRAAAFGRRIRRIPEIPHRSAHRRSRLGHRLPRRRNPPRRNHLHHPLRTAPCGSPTFRISPPLRSSSPFSATMGRINGRLVDEQFSKMYPGEPIKKKK